MTSSRAIAVLGLGRMGTALAARLLSLGWEVTGWTRSGRPAPPVKQASDPAEAVANAGALAKDMALLGAASQSPRRTAGELAGSAAGPEADIAVAATSPPVGDAVLAPLRAYIRGHATGDPSH